MVDRCVGRVILLPYSQCRRVLNSSVPLWTDSAFRVQLNCAARKPNSVWVVAGVVNDSHKSLNAYGKTRNAGHQLQNQDINVPVWNYGRSMPGSLPNSRQCGFRWGEMSNSPFPYVANSRASVEKQSSWRISGEGSRWPIRRRDGGHDCFSLFTNKNKVSCCPICQAPTVSKDLFLSVFVITHSMANGRGDPLGGRMEDMDVSLCWLTKTVSCCPIYQAPQFLKHMFLSVFVILCTVLSSLSFKVPI